MTLRKTFQQDGTTPAEDFRLGAFGGLLAQQGIVHPGDLAVAAHGTPNMSVDVAAGNAWVKGTESANQSYYPVYNDATVNLAVAASDPTNPRWDRVVVKVQDQFYSGSTNTPSVAVVTGTPGVSPSLPAAPANSFDLAKIVVNANATTITSGNLTDLRPNAVLVGGTVVDSAAARARQSTIPEGCAWEETDTNLYYISDGVNYFRALNIGAYTSYTPAWTAATTNPSIGNGSITGGYQLTGKQVDFWANVVAGSTTTYGTGGIWTLSIPVTAGSAGAYPVRAFVRVGGLYTNLVAYITGGSTTITLKVGSGTATTFDTTHPTATFGNGDAFYVSGTYESA